MPIRYSCFISYRHDSIQIARDFQASLEQELSLLTNLPVYRDEERLRGGQFFNEALSSAICYSACMVLIYIPRYFDPLSLYCAREYKAMEQLEARRLSNLKAIGKSENNGLIIPIVYRGFDFLPRHISENRHCYNFEAYYLGGRTQRNNRKYLLAVKDIAKYIFIRSQEISSIIPDPCSGCDSFEIPARSNISRWLNTLSSSGRRPFFPGRGA